MKNFWRERNRAQRWLIGIISVVLTLVLLAAGFWFVFVPHWRPPLSNGERYGIDVSEHQDEINWDAVADDEIDFSYIKASEGRDWVDRRFRVNWAEAKRVGMDRGAYHFFTLCDPGDVQARHFLSVAPPTAGALPPAVDLELAANCSKRPKEAAIAKEVDTFLRILEDAWGQKALLYVGSDWEERYPTQARLNRPLWKLRFLQRPTGDQWAVWQIHGFAHVEGISGGVDLDVMRRGFPPRRDA